MMSRDPISTIRQDLGRVSAIKDLAERVVSQTGDERALESEIWMLVEGKPHDDFCEIDEGVWFRREPGDMAYDPPPHLLTSLDEATAFMDRVCPGWNRWIRHGSGPDFRADAMISSPDRAVTGHAVGNSEPRALVTAVLRAIASNLRPMVTITSPHPRRAEPRHV